MKTNSIVKRILGVIILLLILPIIGGLFANEPTFMRGFLVGLIFEGFVLAFLAFLVFMIWLFGGFE